jgi:hypothetical protein
MIPTDPPERPALADRLVPAALLVAGGALGAAVPFLHPVHGPGYYTNPATATSHLLLFAAVLAVSLGLPALARDGAGPSVGATAGAACYFVGLWCLDGTHGIVDGAVMPALAAHQPKAAALLAHGHASQDLLAFGPMGTIADMGVGLFVAGSLLLGVALARADRLPRTVAWAIAFAWVGMPMSMFIPQVRLVALALPYLAIAAAGAALALRDTRAAAPAAAVPSPAALA